MVAPALEDGAAESLPASTNTAASKQNIGERSGYGSASRRRWLSTGTIGALLPKRTSSGHRRSP